MFLGYYNIVAWTASPPPKQGRLVDDIIDGRRSKKLISGPLAHAPSRTRLASAALVTLLVLCSIMIGCVYSPIPSPNTSPILLLALALFLFVTYIAFGVLRDPTLRRRVRNAFAFILCILIAGFRRISW